MVMIPSMPDGPVKGQLPTVPFLEQFPPGPPRCKDSNRAREQVDANECFIRLYRSKSGKIRIQSSPNLKRHSNYILGGAIQRFGECLGQPADNYHKAGNETVGYQRQPAAASSLNAAEDSSGSICYPFPKRTKRRRSSMVVHDYVSGSEGERGSHRSFPHPGSRKMIQLVIGDEKRMTQWYKDAFHAVQQVACRLVAKVWIKRIQPKKQSTNPYNGNLPKDVLPRDPNRTRPPYWPPHVKHKEPDHITREERINLLVWLITHTPQPEIANPRKPGHEPLLSAETLKEAIEERRSDILDEKWEIIEEIVRIRTIQEAHLRNEMNGDTAVPAMDLSPDTRRCQGETEADIADDDERLANIAAEGDAEGEEQPEEPVITPVSSTLASPIEQKHFIGDHNMNGADREAQAQQHAMQAGHHESQETRNTQHRLLSNQDPADSIHHDEHHVSPTDPVCHDGFEHQFYHQQHEHMVNQQHAPHDLLNACENPHSSHMGMQQWPTSVAPDMLFTPAYVDDGGQQHVMMHSPVQYDGQQYIQLPPGARPQAMYHGMAYPRHVYQDFGPSDQRGLPLRPASGMHQAIINHDVSMMPEYYSL